MKSKPRSKLKKAILALQSLALALAACPTDPDPAPEPPAFFHLGLDLALDARVHSVNAETGERDEFAADREVAFSAAYGLQIRDFGGKGEISGGRLSFDIGAPSPLSAIGTLFVADGSTYKHFSFTPSDAMGVALRGLVTSGEGLSGLARRVAHQSDGTTSILDEVTYVYVDRDVVMRGRGTTLWSEDGAHSWRMRSANIRLLAGWNVLRHRSVSVRTEKGSRNVAGMTAEDPGHIGWELRESGAGIERPGRFAPSAQALRSDA